MKSKNLFILSLLLPSLGAAAQTKPAKDTVKPVPATISTPLLTYQDIQALNDSLLSTFPYKYAPVIDPVVNWLNRRFQQRAAEYLDRQTAKKEHHEPEKKK